MKYAAEHDQRTSGDIIQILIRDTLEGTEIGRRAKQFASELRTILQTGEFKIDCLYLKRLHPVLFQRLFLV